MGGLEGMRLGTYLVQRRLGSGGMGDVYLAEQTELGRTVAIKVIRDESTGDYANAEARAQAHQQFSQEAKAVAALEHPHILPIYDLGEQDGISFLVMQYVRDGSLADLLAPGSLHRLDLPVTPTLVAEIIRQAADGIQFAHDSGIIHRDIKPHNLLVRVLPSSDGSPQYHVLLADFGLARFMAEMTRRTGTIGTPLYSAPEQYTGHPGAATDQYALACVAYLLLAGRPVFDGTVVELHHQHLAVTPPALTSLNAELPAALDDVFARALAKDPALRYAQIREFARALTHALEPVDEIVGAQRAASTVEQDPLPPPRVVAGPPSPLVPQVVPVSGSFSPPAPQTSISPKATPAQRTFAPRVVSPARADAEDGSAGTRSSPFGVVSPSSRAISTRVERRPTSAGQHEPDAPGAPIPRRAIRRRPAGSPPRISKRVRYIGLAAILLVASVSTIGFAAWKRGQLPPFVPTQTVQVVRSGQVDVASLAQFADGQQPAEAILAARTPYSTAQHTGAGSLNSELPSVSPAAVWPGSKAAPTVQTKFGLGQDQVGVDSPTDTSLASGDQYTVEAVDGAIQIFGHDGISDPDRSQIAAASLFGPVLQSNDTLGQPRVLFDSGSQRWILVMNEMAGSGGAVNNGYFDVAISQDARPFTSWSIYQFSTQITGYAACTYADAPQVGSDGFGIYITGNVFLCGSGGAFQGAALWDLPKKAFVTGGAMTIYRWFGQFDNAQHKPVFALCPAQESASDATEWLASDDAGYLADGKTSKQMIIWAVLNAASVDQQHFPTLIGVVTSLPNAYAEPPSAFQPGTSVPLNTGDTRIAALSLSAGHLYGAFVTAINWRGDATTRSGIYWFDIQPRSIAGTSTSSASTIGASVHQTGTFGFANAYLYSPALTADEAGDVILGVGVVSPAFAPGVVYAWHLASDPLNQLGAGQQVDLLAAGAASYTGPHWGDYSGIALGTPASGGRVSSIWLAGAFMEDRPTHWQTLVWELSLK
jgi:serine/threonine protein kinase